MPIPYCLWVIMSAAGCMQSAHIPVAMVGDAANNTTVNVVRGASVDITLDSSYWKFAGSSKPEVLREDGPAKLLPAPMGATCAPGVGCRPVEVKFTAQTPGTAVVTASRSVCGEVMRCAPGQRSYKVTVVVRK